MSFSVFQTLRGVLPHEAARLAYRLVRPQRYRDLDRLHRTPPSEASNISFLPLHETRSIFVHVPKAAGTSVGHSLYGCRTGDHMTLLDYRSVFPRTAFDTAFKFTFVRNPWDRLVSAFFYLQDASRNAYDREQAARSVSNYEGFEDFIENFVPNHDLNAFTHLKEQHLFLRLPCRDIGVDFVGRYERLNEDFGVIAGRLGKDIRLAHRNISDLRKSDYRDLYTPRMIDIVAKAYARDIAYFDYTFEHGGLP